MAGISDRTLGDVGRGLQRYWPVAATVVAILGIVAVFPAPEGTTRQAAFGAWESDDRVVAGEAPSDDDTAAAPPGFAVDEPQVPALEPAPRPAPSPSPGPAGAGAAPPPAGPPPPTPPPGFTVDRDDDNGVLSVAGHGWAARTGGTPLASAGVPEGTMPIGARLGQPEKASFVRLTGDGSVLELLEDPEGGHSFDGDPAVALCRILDPTWEEEEAMAWSDAPEWDPDDCVEGTRGDDARWAFDLSPLGEPAAMAGWALVPGADAPVDFQVALIPA